MHVRRIAFIAGAFALVFGVVVSEGMSHHTAVTAALPSPVKPNSLFGHFQHIIVLIQENRTVDNLFNGFPGADTVQRGNRFGTMVKLIPQALQPAEGGSHSHQSFVNDYDNGKMDGFDWQSKANHTTYAYVRRSDVANYFALGERFTLADEVFQMDMSPSFASHVYLVSGQGGYPWAVTSNETGRFPDGCYGNDTTQKVDLRTPFPGVVVDGKPACMDFPTIFDLLDSAQVDWRYYTASFGITKLFWSAPEYIRHIAKGPDRAKEVTPETSVINDIQSGNLPPVSYVVPQCQVSDHPSSTEVSDPRGGPRWIAAVTNALGSSQYWGNTLVLVTWDDWGGWYDHVKPPIWNANSLGFRTPLLIISAYPAVPGAVDHTRRNQGSILTAIESNFGLPSLGQLDARTDDLSADFNFDQTPVPYGSPLPSATPNPQTKCDGNGEDED
jgi:phospholipase C